MYACICSRLGSSTSIPVCAAEFYIHRCFRRMRPQIHKKSTLETKACIQVLVVKSIPRSKVESIRAAQRDVVLNAFKRIQMFRATPIERRKMSRDLQYAALIFMRDFPPTENSNRSIEAVVASKHTPNTKQYTILLVWAFYR